jgi:dTDP-L-rhamnose 4-epimerase
MKILVTGGAGFIGSHLADRLIEKNHEVVVLDNMEPQVHQNKRPVYLNPGAGFINGDIRNEKVLGEALEGVDVVFHQAAAVGIGQSTYQIGKYTDVNCMGTAKLLQTITEKNFDVKKIILASSVTVYGEGSYECGKCGVVHPKARDRQLLERKQWEPLCPSCRGAIKPIPIKEETPCEPRNVYAITKKMQEELCMSTGLSYGIPVTALRYFVGYGVRQNPSNPYTGVSVMFSARIRNGKPPLIYEDGLQTRDFINVRDIVDANLLALESKAADYEIFNVGTGRPTSIVELAKTLIRLHGKDGSLEPMVTNDYRSSDVRHLFADISKIRKKLGFEPKVKLEAGLEELAGWLKEQKVVDKTDQAQKELKTRGLIS